MDNYVSVTGTTTRAAELRFTPSGAAVANISIAVNRRWQNKQTQEWEEETSFFDVKCWQKLAENVAESIDDKGIRVTVTGRLEQRSWEAQDGSKRSKVEINADDIAISLRWATASAVKNERSDGQHASGGRPAQPAAATWNPSEEPF